MALYDTKNLTGQIADFSRNNQQALERAVTIQANALDPKKYDAFTGITQAYPNMSKDAVMAAVMTGMTKDTPGLSKVVTRDGIAQLQQDSANLRKIASTAGKDRNFAEAVRDYSYNLLKGVSRATFATLQAPYQYFTSAGRDIYASLHGESSKIGFDSQFGVLNKNTYLGQVVQNYKNGFSLPFNSSDTGSGFFVNPASKVGKAQAQAMSAYGQINGKSFTIGRSIVNGIGNDPNSTYYKVGSGIIDAVLSVATDPSTWVGPGSVSKIIRGGKEVAQVRAGAVAASKADTELGMELLGVKQSAEKAMPKEVGTIRRDYQNHIYQAEEDALQAQQDLHDAELLRATRIHTAGISLERSLVGSEEAKNVLSNQKIGDVLVDITSKGSQKDTINTMGRLSADNANTRRALEGSVFVEELPQNNKISLAAMGEKELLVTKTSPEDIKTLDIKVSNLEPGTKESLKEISRRGKFVQRLITGSRNNRLDYGTRIQLGKLANAIDESFVLGTGKLSLAKIIAGSTKLENQMTLEYVMKEIKNIWKPDAITNVRSIHGGNGGVALLNMDKIAGRKVTLTGILDQSISPSLAPNTLFKLDDVVENARASVQSTKDALNQAKEASKENYRRIQEIRALRKVADSDPEIRSKIMNDVEYQDVKHLLGLQDKIVTTEQKYREYLLAETGMISHIGGNIAGDFHKTMSYVLGKNFAPIIKIIANEKDPLKIWRLFGRKIDYEFAQQIADAETIGQVERLFLEHVGSEIADPSVYRSMSLRMQTGKLGRSPLIKVVPKVSDNIVKLLEKTENYYGRFFVRNITLKLDDMDSLVRGIENWGTSAGFKPELVDNIIRKLSKADTPAQKSAAIMNGFNSHLKDIAQGQKVPELIDVLDKSVIITGKDRILLNAYYPEKLATGTVPTVYVEDGKHIPIGSAFNEHQMLDDVIRVPDANQVKTLIESYKGNKLYFGTKRALRAFSADINDLWRTLQLAFRISYIMRNVGEMQVRQYLSGHDSLFNHPLGYIAMIVGNKSGNAAQKLASKFAKYGNDVLDNAWKSKEFDGVINDAMDEYIQMMHRSFSAHDPRTIWTAKAYNVITPNDPTYYKSLAQTIARYRTDEMIPRVAAAVTQQQKDDLVKEILKDAQKSTFLKNMIYGGKNTGKESQSVWAQIFLKDTDKGISKDNINEFNLRSYLFGVEGQKSASIEQEIINVTGGNDTIRELIANGKVDSLYGKKNISETIMVPRFELKTGEDSSKVFDIKLSALTRSLEKHFSLEDLKMSQVIGSSDYAKVGGVHFLNRGMDIFFNFSAKVENIVNFGPEFRMAYYDYVARMIPMLKKEDLPKLLKGMDNALRPLRVGKKFDQNGELIVGSGKAIGTQHPAYKIYNQEIRTANRLADQPGVGISLETLNSAAAKAATKYVENLFYDAQKNRQIAQALRLIFPFAQAQMNTIIKWTKLTKENPVKIYRFGKAYNSLTQEGSSAIYDMTGVNHESNQGFFYKDQYGKTRFTYPLAGTILGGFAGHTMDASNAAELTAPVQSLNLAFGAVNPMVPGVGVAGQFIYDASNKSNLFGPGWNSLRNVIFPFGEPTGIQDYVLPAWLKKSFLNVINDKATIERGTQDWAAYLASTGDYGDNPLSNKSETNRLFNDASQMSKWNGIFQAFFQNIAPATPSTAIYAHDKDGSLRLHTVMFDSFRQMQNKHPGNYFAAVREFADTFGAKNLLVILSGSTRTVQGTQDAWSFLNKHPDVANKYITQTSDVIPYFFPGGESATQYYQWQKKMGYRRNLDAQELEQGASSLVYQMAKSQISEDMATYGYNDNWYQKKIMELDQQFGGSAPAHWELIGTAQEKIAAIQRALKDPVFKESPVYEDTLTYMNARNEKYKYLQYITDMAHPTFTSSGIASTNAREDLNSLATQLIAKNPAFAAMFYRAFASELKVGK